MNVRVLVEDTSSSTEYRSEHGLSLYIETRKHRLLSHGHYDHGGGIAAFLERNKSAVVLVQDHAFEPHFSIRAGGEIANIGLDPALEQNPRVRKMRGAQALDDELTVFSGVQGGILWPPANRTLLMEAPGGHAPDLRIVGVNLNQLTAAHAQLRMTPVDRHQGDGGPDVGADKTR